MIAKISLAFLIFCPLLNAEQKWEQIGTTTPLHVQKREVENLLLRLLPDHSNLFKIRIIGPTFAPKNRDQVALTSEDISTNEIDSSHARNNVRVHVVSNTGVAAIWGINYYLKYFCNSHVSWDTIRLGKFVYFSLLNPVILVNLVALKR